MPAFQLTVYSNEFSLIQSSAQSYTLKRGQTVLNNLMLHNIKTHSKCAGKAICGGCRVKVLSGSEYCNQAVSEEKLVLTRQQLEQGWRLSCQLHCLKDISIFIPENI